MHCWRCKHPMRVISLFCATGIVEGESCERFVVRTMTEASEALLETLRSFPHFRPSHSRTADVTYFANHCEGCGAMQGDFFLHSEPGGAFFPESRQDAERIVFTHIDTSIECEGSEGYSTAMEFAFDQWQARTSE